MAPGLAPLYNIVANQEVTQKSTRFQEINNLIDVQLKLVEERTEALSTRLSGFMRPIPECVEKRSEKKGSPDTPSALRDLEDVSVRIGTINDRLGYILDALGI
jgi:hypothetical protein